MSQFQFDPATYLELMRTEVAAVLARHGGVTAVGVDKSKGMLDAARTRLAGQRVDLVVAALTEPLPAGPFDLVVSALAVHHLVGPDKAALFTRVAAALRPGGRFVLGDVVIPTDPGPERECGVAGEGPRRPAGRPSGLNPLRRSGTGGARPLSWRAP
jgi:SAM-dependent methyltransferase